MVVVQQQSKDSIFKILESAQFTGRFFTFYYSLKCRYLKIKRLMSYRIGSGVDFHQLVEGRDLWIGGIKIPHTKGALGHSDADVLLHAICDAMLGALALGDIGVHFPNNDMRFKDVDSKILLQHTFELIQSKGYKIVNVDSTLCLENPKIKPYVPQMQDVISKILEVTISDISIKATTTETMGFAGREEGLMASASVLLCKQ
jgi:2-C-methyl-D-erythritol 2,4-cyclodiphosphate synthase